VRYAPNLKGGGREWTRMNADRRVPTTQIRGFLHLPAHMAGDRYRLNAEGRESRAGRRWTLG
jgi:hypothetical protein